MNKVLVAMLVASATTTLASCGGGGPINSASNSPPLPAPTPAPTPTPTSVLKPEVLTIGTDATTASYAAAETNKLGSLRGGQATGWKDTESIIESVPSSLDSKISIRFQEGSGLYDMTLPNGADGVLQLWGLSGTVGQFADTTSHHLVDPDGSRIAEIWMPVPAREGYRFTYSHFGNWTSTSENSDGTATQVNGWFVYGYEAPESAIPRTGMAQYSADIYANSPLDPFEVGGTATLLFDFGAGTLSGEMHPVHSTNGFYTEYDYDYGIYRFADTVYSVGSPRYSGKLSKDGQLLAGSWFNGSLTGPYADEVIGRFVAPFSRSGYNGNLTGIWIGKKN